MLEAHNGHYMSRAVQEGLPDKCTSRVHQGVENTPNDLKKKKKHCGLPSHQIYMGEFFDVHLERTADLFLIRVLEYSRI